MKENRDLHRMFSQSAMDVWYFKSATISRLDFTRGGGRKILGSFQDNGTLMKSSETEISWQVKSNKESRIK